MSNPPLTEVTIHATARLHLGFIDLHGGLGRIYGSLGVSLEHPEWVLKFRRIQKGLNISGEQPFRVKSLATQLVETLGYIKGLEIIVQESIPEHVGLGSGTQLALAMGTGITILHDVQMQPYTIASLLNRGTVSGVGTATFTEGGFVIDGGKSTLDNDTKDSVPPLLVSYEVPNDWYFVIAIPKIAEGLSGEREQRAFVTLPSAKPKQAQLTSRLVLMKLLPALVENDIEGFGEALTQIQKLVGDAFATAQGGRFASTEVTDCVNAMLDAGALGAGQSSWGPACYGLIRGEKAASKIQRAVSEVMDAATGGSSFISTVNNHGAQIIAT
jgi:beta-ribofuranosylaminobenzene 5'-phosphate synthase